MAVLNPSFEDAGLLPGEAEHWTLVAVASLEAIAGFGADPELAWEGFERWTELWLALDDVPVVPTPRPRASRTSRRPGRTTSTSGSCRPRSSCPRASDPATSRTARAAGPTTATRGPGPT